MVDDAEDADGANPDDDDVFVYTTGSIVPRDVVRVRVHPSVTVIPREAFMLCEKLEEVELSEGLLEIGQMAFASCEVLKRIKIPSTVTIIGNLAFYSCCQLEEADLCEGILEIGQSAFSFCKSLKHINLPPTIRRIGLHAFAETKSLLNISLPEELENVGVNIFLRGGLCTLRIPPLVTRIPKGVVQQAKSLFSIELSESVTHVESYAFACCYSLRNVAISPNTSIENDEAAFGQCKDLLQLFDSGEQIINALKHRFDTLPILKMLYYQSYESVTVEQLNDATNMRSGQRRILRSKLDPTGKQQDCLGMTPLHILACSTVQNLDLYKVIVDKYPENLITEDEWGTLPLLYAVWGNAPSEIVQYLVERYQSIYPEYELDWTYMVETLSLANLEKSTIQNLVDLQLEFFSEQSIDWREVVNKLVECESWEGGFGIYRSFKYIVQRSLIKRIDKIGLEKWRNIISCGIESIPDYYESYKRKTSLDAIHSKLSMFETEYQNLKEATTIVELAFWKKRMSDFGQKREGRNDRKKMKLEDIREQCRISCGADIVIEHLLPYLLPATDEIEHQPAYSDDESNSDSSLFGGDSDDSDEFSM